MTVRFVSCVGVRDDLRCCGSQARRSLLRLRVPTPDRRGLRPGRSWSQAPYIYMASVRSVDAVLRLLCRSGSAAPDCRNSRCASSVAVRRVFPGTFREFLLPCPFPLCGNAEMRNDRSVSGLPAKSALRGIFGRPVCRQGYCCVVPSTTGNLLAGLLRFSGLPMDGPPEHCCVVSSTTGNLLAGLLRFSGLPVVGPPEALPVVAPSRTADDRFSNILPVAFPDYRQLARVLPDPPPDYRWSVLRSIAGRFYRSIDCRSAGL